MCGRFALSSQVKVIAKYFGVPEAGVRVEEGTPATTLPPRHRFWRCGSTQPASANWSS